MRYQPVRSLANFLRMFGSAKAPTSIKLDLMENLTRLEAGRVYLLPPFYAP